MCESKQSCDLAKAAFVLCLVLLAMNILFAWIDDWQSTEFRQRIEGLERQK
jgi:hypothetical protein